MEQFWMGENARHQREDYMSIWTLSDQMDRLLSEIQLTAHEVRVNEAKPWARAGPNHGGATAVPKSTQWLIDG
jgi:hypothetical protein